MKRDFIVATVAREDVEVQVELKGRKTLAKVPGITIEMIDMESGKAHTHTFFDDLEEAGGWAAGTELTVSIDRKHASTAVAKPDHKKVDQYRNPALTDSDKTESQLQDEEKQRAAIKSGKPDPVTVPKGAK